MITPAAWKAPFQVNTTQTNTQFEGNLAAAADGSYYALWTDLSGVYGFDSVIVARKYDASGNPLTDEVALTGNAFHGQAGATVSADQHLLMTYYDDQTGDAY